MGYFNRTGLSARARVGSGLALVGCLALAPGSARAASPLPELWTVCASGCSFSSLSQAVTDAAVHSGDGLEVLPDKIYAEQVSVTKRLDIFAAADGPRPEITWAGANGTTLAITSGGAGTTITHLDIRATGLAGTALNAAGAVSASDLALTTSGVGASLAGLDAQLGPDVTATVTGNGGTAIDAAAGASVTGLT